MQLAALVAVAVGFPTCFATLFGPDDRGYAQNRHLGSIAANTLGTFKGGYCEKVVGWNPAATAATTPGSIDWCQLQTKKGADEQVT